MFQSAESRWRAVQSRSDLARSAFVFAVLSTRIYCRPTCPARLARRANVIFYDLPEEAEAQGFRPCKRCKPEMLEDDVSQQESRRVISTACTLMQRQPQLTVREVSRSVGLSTRYFYTAFRRVVGTTPGIYVRQMQEFRQKEPDNSSPSPAHSVSQKSSSTTSLTIACDYEDFGLVDDDYQASLSFSGLLASADGRQRGYQAEDSEFQISNTEWLALHEN